MSAAASATIKRDKVSEQVLILLQSRPRWGLRQGMLPTTAPRRREADSSAHAMAPSPHAGVRRRVVAETMLTKDARRNRKKTKRPRPPTLPAAVLMLAARIPRARRPGSAQVVRMPSQEEGLDALYMGSRPGLEFLRPHGEDLVKGDLDLFVLSCMPNLFPPLVECRLGVVRRERCRRCWALRAL